jgi:D-psicose/D-tagatose/L-ribulose 3-epimerase
MLKYSVHAWAWSPMWTADSLNLIDRAKELGFDALEIPLWVTSTVDAAATKARAAAAGIEVLGCLGCHPNADPTADDEEIRAASLDYLRERIQLTADLGGRVLGGTIYAAGRKLQGLPTEELWERSATVVRKAASFARELGVTLGIEPVSHSNGFLINTAEQAVKMVKTVNEPNLGILLDSAHMNIEEDSFYDATAAAAPYLCHFHLCENHRGEIGTGHVNFDEIYRALAEAGYSGTAGLEMPGPALAAAWGMWRGVPANMDEVSARSLARLKSIEAMHFRN